MMNYFRIDDRFGVCYDIRVANGTLFGDTADDKWLTRLICAFGHWGGITWAVGPDYYFIDGFPDHEQNVG